MTFPLTRVHIILVRFVLLSGHFIGTLPLLIITLRVAMATMHFHIAQTGLSSFLENIFLSQSVNPREQFCIIEKLSLCKANF